MFASFELGQVFLKSVCHCHHQYLADPDHHHLHLEGGHVSGNVEIELKPILVGLLPKLLQRVR